MAPRTSKQAPPPMARFGRALSNDGFSASKKPSLAANSPAAELEISPKLHLQAPSPPTLHLPTCAMVVGDLPRQDQQQLCPCNVGAHPHTNCLHLVYFPNPGGAGPILTHHKLGSAQNSFLFDILQIHPLLKTRPRWPSVS